MNNTLRMPDESPTDRSPMDKSPKDKSYPNLTWVLGVLSLGAFVHGASLCGAFVRAPHFTYRHWNTIPLLTNRSHNSVCSFDRQHKNTRICVIGQCAWYNVSIIDPSIKSIIYSLYTALFMNKVVITSKWSVLVLLLTFSSSRIVTSHVYNSFKRVTIIAYVW